MPLISPNAQRVAVRSSLQYKYRPSLRYEVELANGFVPGEPIGTLTANFRTQSQALLELLNRFFRCLCRIEGRMLPLNLSYSLENGRFTRSLAYPVPRNDGAGSALSAETISGAITDYVRLIDRMLKACVGGADAQTLAEMYDADLAKRTLLI